MASRSKEIDRFILSRYQPEKREDGPFVLYTDHVRIVRELQKEIGSSRMVDGPVDAVCPKDGSMVRLEGDLRCSYRSECVEDCVFGIGSRR